MPTISEVDRRRLEERVGVPRKILRDLEQLDLERPAVIEALGFVDATDRRPCLVLGGAVGVGKSCAAAWAAANAKKPRRTVRYHDHRDGSEGEMELEGDPVSAVWVHALDLFRASTYDREFWPRVERPILLVIDDLGAVSLDAKGHAAETLANLLCRREARDAKTIITCNITAEQFLGDYCSGAGERVRDRLRAHGRWFFSVPGASLRGRQAS